MTDLVTLLHERFAEGAARLKQQEADAKQARMRRETILREIGAIEAIGRQVDTITEHLNDSSAQLASSVGGKMAALATIARDSASMLDTQLTCLLTMLCQEEEGIEPCEEEGVDR